MANRRAAEKQKKRAGAWCGAINRSPPTGVSGERTRSAPYPVACFVFPQFPIQARLLGIVFGDGFGSECGVGAGADGGGVRAGGAGGGVGGVVGGVEGASAGGGGGGGAGGFVALRREQGAGGEGEDSAVPGPVALADDRAFAVEQVPGCGGVVRDGAECG